MIVKARVTYSPANHCPENLDFDLEKFWKCPGKMHIDSVGTLIITVCSRTLIKTFLDVAWDQERILYHQHSYIANCISFSTICSQNFERI